METQERQFYVLHQSNEPRGEFDVENRTVRPVDQGLPCLAPVLNFENPEDPAVTLREAMAEIYIGAGLAISLTPDESGTIFTKDEVDKLFAAPDNSDIQLTVRFRNPDGSWHTWLEKTFTEEAGASSQPKKKRSASLSRMARTLGAASDALIDKEQLKKMLVRDIRDIFTTRDFDRMPCVVLYQDLRTQPHERWLRSSDCNLGALINKLLGVESEPFRLLKGRREDCAVSFADYCEKFMNEEVMAPVVRGFHISRFEESIEKLLGSELPRTVAVCSPQDRGTCTAWSLKRNTVRK